MTTMDFGVRDMEPGVTKTLIVCGTVLGLGLLSVIGWLLYAERDTAALLTLVNALITAAVYAKLRNVESRTERVEHNTNGITSRALDSALGPQQPTTPAE